MLRNRRRRGNRRREGEQGSASVDSNAFHNLGYRNTRMPTNPHPSMQPDYNPFRSQAHELISRSRPNRPNNLSLHAHRSPYPTTSQRIAARDRALFQADWKLQQRHLKQQLVHTLHLAVQTIELWLPDTTPFEDFYEDEAGSEASDDTVDEMEWQLEKEIVIPDPPNLRYTWGTAPDFVPRGNGSTQFGWPTTPPYTPENAAARQRGEQASCWSL